MHSSYEWFRDCKNAIWNFLRDSKEVQYHCRWHFSVWARHSFDIHVSTSLSEVGIQKFDRCWDSAWGYVYRAVQLSTFHSQEFIHLYWKIDLVLLNLRCLWSLSIIDSKVTLLVDWLSDVRSAIWVFFNTLHILLHSFYS